MAGRPHHPPPTQKERQKHKTREARPKRKTDQEGEEGTDKEEGIPRGREE